jgi:hypothetical protein
MSCPVSYVLFRDEGVCYLYKSMLLHTRAQILKPRTSTYLSLNFSLKCTYLLVSPMVFTICLGTVGFKPSYGYEILLCFIHEMLTTKILVAYHWGKGSF